MNTQQKRESENNNPMSTATSEKTEPGTIATDGPILMAGRPVAAEIRKKCYDEIAVLRERYGLLPGLRVVRVGDDQASVSYAERIIQSFTAAGLHVAVEALPANASRGMLQAEVSRLSVLPQVAGIIVQMPLPKHITLRDVIDVLSADKDVDGIHPTNAGRLALGLDCFVPATPSGGMALLDYYGITVEGKRALVIGRSDIVGKPLAQLLLARHATVTIAHSRSRDIPALIGESDIVASAIGRAGFVKGDWLKPGATVLDFGASIVDGQMCGDVEFETASRKARAITPVPGGTGPVTNAMLLRNTVNAIHRALKA